MKNENILHRLKNLLSNKSDLIDSGPTSVKGQQWLADTIAALNKADPDSASEFDHLSQYLYMPLSSYTLDPILERMLLILRCTISMLEMSAFPREEKIYAQGDQYALYKDLKEIIGNSKSEVFIIDPYANEEIFDLYLEKVGSNVAIRFLTKDPSSALRSVISKFAAKPSINFEARNSHDIHDRVIFIDETDCWILGQSFKNAASKKPTYLIPIESRIDMKNLYEDIWKKGIAIK